MPEAPSLAEALAAVAVLTRTGVSDETLGRAVREWLVTTESGGPLPVSGPHPFSKMARVAAPPVEASTATSPEMPGVTLTSPVPSELTPEYLVEGDLVWLKLRMPGKTATNIVVPQRLLSEVGKRFGGDSAARSIARELAKTAPDGSKKRSPWVVQQLLNKVATPL